MTLIAIFCVRVRADEQLDPASARAIPEEHWAEYLGHVSPFWSSVMLSSGRHHGKPVQIQAKNLDVLTPSSSGDCPSRLPCATSCWLCVPMKSTGVTCTTVWPQSLALQKGKNTDKDLWGVIPVEDGSLWLTCLDSGNVELPDAQTPGYVTPSARMLWSRWGPSGSASRSMTTNHAVVNQPAPPTSTRELTHAEH